MLKHILSAAVIFVSGCFSLCAMEHDVAKNKESGKNYTHQTQLLCLKNLYKDSWLTQKRDLGLVDYTDKHGFLKLHGQLQGRDPTFVHLFKISSQDGSNPFAFYLFGTCHCLDLCLLPNSVKDILHSGPALVVEDDNVGLFTRERLEELGMLSKEEWLDCFIDREKNHYLACVNDMFATYHIYDVKPEELSPYFAFHFYLQSSNLGMDRQLVSHYHNLPLLKLEEFATTSTMVEDIFGKKEDALESLSLNIVHDLTCGGGLNSPDYLYLANVYLNTPFLTPSFLEQESTALRNAMWMPKLAKYLQRYPNGLVAAVGAAHLYGDDGLLSLFAIQHCQIERITVEAESVLIYKPEN